MSSKHSTASRGTAPGASGQSSIPADGAVSGAFVTLNGERYYGISNVDKMPPFFISLVSDNDLWMFVSSNGGLTAGRVSPEQMLFPYVTVDKLYDSTPHTGCKTVLRVLSDGKEHLWEPFNREHDGRYCTQRNLYKNVLGNKLLFEEINADLHLSFRYSWAYSDEYGFVRSVELENTGTAACRVELLDGIQNILPAGTPAFTQTNSSYLVDAYKWSELDEATGLAMFTLFSGISDRAEPCESLRANTVFSLGLKDCRVLLSSEQLNNFRNGAALKQERRKRGLRGAYFVNGTLELPAQSAQNWQIVADVEKSQAEAVALRLQLKAAQDVAAAIKRSVASGSDALARILAASDGFQTTAEENVAVHHYANTLFNVLRGGIVDQQYLISTINFGNHLQRFNTAVHQRHRAMLDALPEQIEFRQLQGVIQQQGDLQLERLSQEYLPITFGRRHGDPSRPWNQFAIRLTDDQGNRLLTYQGNWRDIFQNWEALLFSYPEFIENVIAKFVNATTADGYNPYRITDEGFDWEVEEPDDPWSYIGYWGDHQIIYLQKLLELSEQFHPAQLSELLHHAIYSYANVPYRIKPFAAIVENAKSTVEYDNDLAERIEQRVSQTGADGKLLLDSDGHVVQVNLLEKLLVTLLAKLSNLVVDGGIWLNTQRPEWNDANNALVGQGLSMVTLYYLRRYVTFLQQLLVEQTGTTDLSAEVGDWLTATADALHGAREALSAGPLTPQQRFALLATLGEAASVYRQTIYARESFSGKGSRDIAQIRKMLSDALAVIDHSIRTNAQEDGLYHAYNLLELQKDTAQLDTLYPMLEGQVAVLSSGAITPRDAVRLLDALFASDLFRADQQSFLLYPERELPDFLEKNCVPAEQVQAIPLLGTMTAQDDTRIMERDAAGTWRFHPDLHNVGDLNARLDELAPTFGDTLAAAREPLQALYEQVFQHKAFTGRSGGMFAFEGLGSIYWHMVAKLLLAVQENFFTAREQGADEKTCQRLAELYYRIRAGIGFNKTPAEYGAFPMDPYSHTPGHMGAQQPGMTGQVKEELLARFGELGIRVINGAVQFDPSLLRPREFLAMPQPFRYVDTNGQWQELTVPANGLAFTWCQVPLVYRLDDSLEPSVTVHNESGESETMADLCLPSALASQLFLRDGSIRRIELVLPGRLLSPH